MKFGRNSTTEKSAEFKRLLQELDDQTLKSFTNIEHDKEHPNE